MSDSTAAPPVGDYDSPWKEALDRFFPEFMSLLFSEVERQIDWSLPPVFLDKELQDVVRDGESGRNYADKLVEVRTLTGDETWVLLHIEIQGRSSDEFLARMFRYYYRLQDRYPEKSIASFAVLTDSTGSGTFQLYRKQCFGCEASLKFPVVHLQNWRQPELWRMLEASDNVFALVVMAQLQAHSLKEGRARKAAKIELVRSMNRRGYSRGQILELFRLIDWLLKLPPEIECEFELEIDRIEKENAMVYVTSVERIRRERVCEEARLAGQQAGLQEGRQEGRQAGQKELLAAMLTRKFGRLPDSVTEKMELADSEQIGLWADKLWDATSLDELFAQH